MPTWDDVERIVAALPEVTGGSSWGQNAWKVRTKTFAWERPLRPRELADLGGDAPAGEILGVRVADEGEKVAALQGNAVFTIPHFNGYPAVLIRLDDIGIDELTELLEDAWLCQAPKTVAKKFLAAD